MANSTQTTKADRAARIRLALVDDDPHYRLYLESVFGASSRHEVIATAGSADEVPAWPADARLHVALLDIGLPGRTGAQLVADLLARHPGVLVIMLTAIADDGPVLESIRGGAVGYILKGASEREIIEAIDDALAGGAPMSPAIARKVLGLMRAAPAAKAAPPVELAMLTSRETEIVELVAGGASDKEVADRLGLARSTVKNALLSVYSKWRVRTRTEAAVKFLRTQGG